MNLAPNLHSPLSSPLHGMFGRESYPSGAILHFDANADPYTEQTGGPHTFNQAILAPQFQRQADGSVIGVGAKVAADFYGGERWVRSCGAIANLLPSGAEGFTTSWGYNGCSLVSGKVVAAASTSQKYFTSPLYAFTSGVAYTQALRLKYSGVRYVQLTMGGAAFGSSQYANFDLIDGTVAFSTGCIASIVAIGDSFLCSITATATATASASGVVCAFAPVFNSVRLPVGFVGDGVIGVIPSEPIFTATAYPVPYVPPGVTQPASNATATNGMWFANPDDLALWDLLTGDAMAAGIRVRLNFASTDLPNSSTLNIVTPDDVAGRFLTIQKDAGGALTAKLSDGTNTASVTLAAWARNAVLHLYPQVKAGATQMRIGYKTAAATSITWGTAATYAGTFGPDATLDRLMIGFNNAYPFSVSKFTVVPGEIADAEILGWWA